jgi:hypothetical protein
MSSQLGLLIQVEAFLLCGRQQSLAQDILGRVFWQLQVVHASVHRGVAPVIPVHFTHHRESGLEISQATRRQRRTTRGELQECLALIAIHIYQHTHEPLEARTATKPSIDYRYYAHKYMCKYAIPSGKINDITAGIRDYCAWY